MGEKETASRLAGGAGGFEAGPEPEDAAVVKSKSNITNNREEAGGGEGPEPAEASNLNLSKSN
jgi:hypothetical protein